MPPRRQGRATIADVARLAGVSKATVSYVLSGRVPVREDTRARVLAAVRQLEYVPNQLARGLARKVSGTVGLIVPVGRPISDPFVASFLQAVGDAVTEKGYALLLIPGHASVRRIVEERRVDGLILLEAEVDDERLRRTSRLGVPVVLCGKPPQGVDVPYVDVDNVLGGRLATSHLLSLGHRRVAHIAAPQRFVYAVERRQGYCQALEEAGLAPEEALVEEGRLTEESGAEAMRRILARCPNVTAVFCASDLMAVGALRTLRDEGRRIPEDAAVVGYDDAAMAPYTEPPLTTVAQPSALMGKAVAQLLLQSLGAGEAELPSGTILAPRLVVRRSSLGERQTKGGI